MTAVTAYGLLVSSGVARDTAGTATQAGTLEAVDLRVGDCFREPPVGEFTAVRAAPCAQPHDAEVVSVVRLPEGSWESEAVLEAKAEERCTPGFAAYVGRERGVEEPTLRWVTPTKEGWELALDREVTCYAFPSPPRVGSVKAGAR